MRSFISFHTGPVYISRSDVAEKLPPGYLQLVSISDDRKFTGARVSQRLNAALQYRKEMCPPIAGGVIVPVSISEQFLSPEIAELFERRTRKTLAYPQEEHVIPVRNEPHQAKARYSIWISVIKKRIFDFRLQESPIHRAIAVVKTAFASRYLCWDEQFQIYRLSE